MSKNERGVDMGYFPLAGGSGAKASAHCTCIACSRSAVMCMVKVRDTSAKSKLPKPLVPAQ